MTKSFENLDACRVYVFVFGFKHFETSINAMQCWEMHSSHDLYSITDRFTCSTQHSYLARLDIEAKTRELLQICPNFEEYVANGNATTQTNREKIKLNGRQSFKKLFSFFAIRTIVMAIHEKLEIEFRTKSFTSDIWALAKIGILTLLQNALQSRFHFVSFI